jgi:transcriptional regulator with XRE-family HTH domain
MNLKQQIGVEFQRARGKKTKKEIAESAAMDENDYRKYELGQRNISAETIERIATALKKKPQFNLK